MLKHIFKKENLKKHRDNILCFYSNGQSISECPIHKLIEQEKKELVFNTLKQFTYEGKVKRSTVREIETIFKEVKELNELIRKGRIKRKNNEAETYICSY
ncbi:hypothetical protein [Bacillus sp. FSL M7-1345]|uniref:hypothetical protein n=1 Tax=Bacillus sp. FSL M7-1345 TaxID=2921541 RepID=UPI0030F966B9